MSINSFKPRFRNDGITENQLLAELKRVNQLLKGKPLTRENYDRHAKYGSHLIVKKIGWNVAKNKLGFSIKAMNYTDKQLMYNLYFVWLRIGKQPSKADMIKPNSTISSHPYISRYGSWKSAIVAFSNTIKRNKPYLKKIEALENKRPKKNNTPRFPSAALKLKVIQRDKYKCPFCPPKLWGQKEEYVIDHIVPWAKRGETVLDNLQVLCKDHNASKSAIIIAKK
jgi:hypothetical protein